MILVDLQQIAFKNLVQRNREREKVHGAPAPNSAIQLPYIIVNTNKKTVIDCSISSDKSVSILLCSTGCLVSRALSLSLLPPSSCFFFGFFFPFFFPFFVVDLLFWYIFLTYGSSESVVFVLLTVLLCKICIIDWTFGTNFLCLCCYLLQFIHTNLNYIQVIFNKSLSHFFF